MTDTTNETQVEVTQADERAKLLEAENARLRDDLVKYADREIMGYCESCMAPVFPEDETFTDPNGDCIGCWYGMTEIQSKRDRPCYAYRVGKPDARLALTQTGTCHDAGIKAEKRNNALAEELTDVEAEAALTSEGIYVWGPDGERFERMFKVVMQSRIAALKGDE